MAGAGNYLPAWESISGVGEMLNPLPMMSSFVGEGTVVNGFAGSVSSGVSSVLTAGYDVVASVDPSVAVPVALLGGLAIYGTSQVVSGVAGGPSSKAIEKNTPPSSGELDAITEHMGKMTGLITQKLGDIKSLEEGVMEGNFQQGEVDSQIKSLNDEIEVLELTKYSMSVESKQDETSFGISSKSGLFSKEKTEFFESKEERDAALAEKKAEDKAAFSGWKRTAAVMGGVATVASSIFLMV